MAKQSHMELSVKQLKRDYLKHLRKVWKARRKHDAHGKRSYLSYEINWRDVLNWHSEQLADARAELIRRGVDVG